MVKGIQTALLCLLAACAIGCRQAQAKISQQDLVGRWQIQEGASLIVPHSFFWFSMDVLEIRPDGSMLGLMFWPPDSGEELRLNKTAEYRMLDDGRLEIIGSCRHEDPCSAVYDLNRTLESLWLSRDSSTMELKYISSDVGGIIPTVIGPAPTP